MRASFFDLMRYASTGIASPDMTAFDKMRALAAFGGGKVQTLTGVPPLSFRANGKPLIPWSMLGNGQQTGTPTPDAPIMPDFCGVRTGNLAPPLTQWVDGYINSTTGDIAAQTAQNYEKTSDYIPVNALSAYRFSHESGNFPSDTNDAWRAAGLYAADKSFISRIGGTGGVGLTINTTEETAFVRLSFRTFGETGNTMLNTGTTALPYEPYGWAEKITCAGQTVPVYLGQVNTVRRIKKLVLTGEEEFAGTATEGLYIYNQFTSVTDYLRSGDNAVVCTHYQGIEPVQRGVDLSTGQTALLVSEQSANKYLYFRTSYPTPSHFKSYLATQYANGTPVTIWYVLAEPTTGIVNEPLCKIGDYADELHSADAGVTIPTAKGANVLTVDTELQPSSMSVTGHIKSS